jgi:CRISPR-associated protein Cas5d
MENKVEFKVSGKYALFTDPLTKIGGEKCSYQIPTYQALKGIMESIYWKPTLIWFIDKVRVIKAIRTQTRSTKPLNYSGGNSLAIYNYLYDVEYQVQSHFEWNMNRTDMEKDRNENKHYFVAKRMIERGGRRDIFLGTRECQGYVEPCQFGKGEGCYDQCGKLEFQLMFHGFDYPDESEKKGQLCSRFWRPKMVDGVIEFERPDECCIRKTVKKMLAKEISSVGLDEEGLLEGYEEEVI